MNNNYEQYFQDGGEMGALTRSFDWEQTVLGHPRSWSVNLLTTISIILNSRFPMFLWWGPELIQFYNDAYRPSLGNNGKHPAALGQRGADCWQEIWPVIKPLIDQVMAGGESTWSEDQLIPIYRNNRLEDVYWTFSYSKVIEQNGKIGGVLVTCTETTKQVNAFRELQQAKSELDFAISAAELGTWDLNPVTNTFMGNDRLKSWFGLPPEAEIELSRATDVIADTDRPAVLQAITEAMTYGSGGNYDMEYTIINPQQPRPKLVKAKGKALFNGNHEVIRFSGTLQDITGERNALYDLREVNQKLALALEQSRLSKVAARLGTFDMDLLHDTLEWDDRCRTLFGITHKNIVSYKKDFLTGLHPEDRERVSGIIKNVFIKSVTDGNYDVEYRTIGVEDGKMRWVRAIGKAYFNELEEPVRFIGSVLDITEQKTNELRKNDFIGMVSHELKTPLTTLTAIIQLMQLKLKGNPDTMVTGGMEKALAQARKMNSLINNFLDISRLETGKIVVHKEPFDMRLLLADIISDLSYTTDPGNINCVACDSIVLVADREKIASVISNLLSNAIKYATPGAAITVSCLRDGDELIFSVRDIGSGIVPEDLERLFERFYRVENQKMHRVPGFGIGLYLCAEIIALHNGKIWAESEVGKGSVFTFTLPLQ